MYDYVIVGAGSAGCVLANRLSEDADVRVLLVEAGPPDTADFIHIPAAFSALFRTQHDWDHMTGWEPGAHNRRIYLPRGRMLGGSSSLNAMIYMRGNPLDYDEWRDAGCAGWGWDDLLPYFKRAEDNERGEASSTAPAGRCRSAKHARGASMCQAFLEAADAMGLPANDDFNDGEQDGFGWYQVTQRDGRRASTAVAYLHPVMERPNLTVETYAHVLKIALRRHPRERRRRPAGGRAARVPRRARGDRVRRRLQLAAAAHAVGHRAPGGARAAADPARGRVARGRHEPPGPPDRGRDLLHPGRWLAQGRAQRGQPRPVDAGPGPLTSNIGENGGFVRTREALPAPDVQFHMVPVVFEQEGLLGPPAHGFTLSACVLKPQSRGMVAVTTPDPTAKPFIVHGYYTDPEDVRSGVAGMRMVMDFVRQAPLSRYAETPNTVRPVGRRRRARAHMRQTLPDDLPPDQHLPDGRRRDVGRRPELRVRGVDGLRVVDASVMPACRAGTPTRR